jgi:hypothetical protein
MVRILRPPAGSLLRTGHPLSKRPSRAERNKDESHAKNPRAAPFPALVVVRSLRHQRKKSSGVNYLTLGSRRSADKLSRGAMRIQFAAIVFDLAFHCDGLGRKVTRPGVAGVGSIAPGRSGPHQWRFRRLSAATSIGSSCPIPFRIWTVDLQTAVRYSRRHWLSRPRTSHSAQGGDRIGQGGTMSGRGLSCRKRRSTIGAIFTRSGDIRTAAPANRPF